MTHAFRLEKITKAFGDVLACDGVDLAVRRGHIHALVGENGAGKSTLMKILFGLLSPDGGRVLLEGAPLRMKNSQEAISRGLGMVHQHLKIIPALTVLENVVLGCEPASGWRLRLDRARREVERLVRQLGFNLDPERPVEELSLGQRQHLEIVKALYRRARVLILDEPTSVLGPLETEELFALLRRLRGEGHTIIFISHKLDEVLQLADRVTVMRRGRHVRTLDAARTDVGELACLMMDEDIALPANERRAVPGAPVLELCGVCSRSGRGGAPLRGVSLTVRSGEIVGVVGVAGNGQSELAELVTGLLPAQSGRMRLAGRDVAGFSPRRMRRAGVAHIPQDRHRRGVAEEFTVRENLLLGRQEHARWRRWGCWRPRVIRRDCEALLEAFNVRPPLLEKPVRFFSGGNQQKIVLARELSRPYSLLVACQPVRGLDVAATAYVYKRLLEEKEAGKGILLVSTDLEDVLALSDRIAVMFRGRIIKVVCAGALDRGSLGRLMGGVVEKGGGRNGAGGGFP